MHADFVRRYFDAIASGAILGREGDWYCNDAVQFEYPNRITPVTARRSFADIKAAAERGALIVESQRYEILSLVEQDDKVAVQAVFRAAFKTDLPGLPKGREMTAHLGIFFVMRAGKIARQENYDCFEPW
jgi:ketosteroid isomerase-like protein